MASSWSPSSDFGLLRSGTKSLPVASAEALFVAMKKWLSLRFPASKSKQRAEG